MCVILEKVLGVNNSSNFFFSLATREQTYHWLIYFIRGFFNVLVTMLPEECLPHNQKKYFFYQPLYFRSCPIRNPIQYFTKSQKSNARVSPASRSCVIWIGDKSFLFHNGFIVPWSHIYKISLWIIVALLKV